MKYDFDQLIDRHGDHSVKYQETRCSTDEKLIPLWVADMDFPTLPEVSQALIEKAKTGIFGYTSPWPGYYEAVSGWMKRRHGMAVEKDWIVPVCGVVPAIRLLIEAFVEPSESVMIFSPVYYPFKCAIEEAERICIESPLIEKDGCYSIDFETTKDMILRYDVRMIIFCSPHNPIGRVWSAEEMDGLAELCRTYDVMMVSDEIHMDFDRTGKFISFLNRKVAPKNLIVCTAPSKTFNLAGLDVSNLIIPDDHNREHYQNTCRRYGMNTPNVMGLLAAEAAYTHGDQWVDELNAYLAGTIEEIKERLARDLPSVKVVDCQGLYLLWLDFRAYGLSPEELEKRMLEKAHLWMDEGYIFGPGGEGFERMNLAAPRATIRKALDQMVEAFQELEPGFQN